MASLWGLLNSLTNGGELHDYAHAAQVFRTNGFSRSPKYKFSFYVNFVLAADVPKYISTREIGYLVKSIDLPKFSIDVKDLNQYNRHVYVQDKIKYEPVTIKFHDDNNNGLRQLWQDYYTYYYADGTYDSNVYNRDDRYQERTFSAWGLDNGSTTPFFSAVEIYSLYGGESNKITLMNPVITNFSHDTHDYADNTNLMEATMQLRYNGVIYEEGFVSGIPGFNESAYYDNNPSPLSGKYAGGYYVNPITGQLEQQGNNFSNRNSYNQQQTGYYGFADQVDLYNPTSNQGLSPVEINNIIYNNSLQTSGDTVFPVAQLNDPIVAQNAYFSSERNLEGIPINADNLENTNNPINPYENDSWQNILWNQGYSSKQINNATSFVDTIPNETLSSYNGFSNIVSSQALIAQKYIDDPNSVSDIGTINYGQPNSVPTNLNFGDPVNPPIPLYYSNDWQNTLLSEGYSQSEINTAAVQINKLNLSPGTDLVYIAKNYIQYKKS